MTKHTAGPWVCERIKDKQAAELAQRFGLHDAIYNNYEVRTEATFQHTSKFGGPRYIANVYRYEANARLIAVAPEMLALLEKSQRNLTGDWRERRDALLERLNGDEE